MIRAPVLPHSREALWALVAVRLEVVERGLVLVAEGVDCSDGHYGAVEGLARDASGAPVLVLVAVDNDPLLPARVVAACEFLVRVGDSLVNAVPEANFCGGRSGRVFVVGGAAAAASMDLMRRLALPGLQICRLESFRIGGAERLAVRWLTAGPAASVSAPATVEPAVEFDVPPGQRGEWETIRSVCERIDPTVRIDGDRFLRRVTWHGRLLGEVVTSEGELRALDHEGGEHDLRGCGGVRRFADTLLRRYAEVAGLQIGGAGPATTAPTRTRAPGAVANGRGSRGPQGESLRDALNASRVSQEEFSALGALPVDPPIPDGTEKIGSTNGISAATDPWPPPKRPE